MEINNKISIPKPCHENWDKMTPNESGRFCMSCSKTVIDFTNMLPEEIRHYFIQNQNNKICGRFKSMQLDTLTIQIPNRVLYSQTNYSKIFLLALFVAMGTTLFSCADKEGKKVKIDKIEVVKNTDPTEQVLVGEPALDENDTIHTVLPPPPPPKADQVKFVNPKETNNLKSDKPSCVKSEKVSIKKKNDVKPAIYVTGEIVSETNAEFPGGIDRFYTFFAKEFKRPENTDVIKTTLAFAVEKNGSVSYLQCSPAVNEAVEKEIVRVLSQCPKWQPGLSDGKKAKKQYSLPIVLQ